MFVEYIFCGSRLGDSLLVKYEQQTQENKKREKAPVPEKNPKRRKLNNGYILNNLDYFFSFF